MGFTHRSEQKRAENEVIFKQQNDRVQQHAQNILPPEAKADFAVGFTCECSDENCLQPISLTVVDFERYRESSRHFFLVPGHEQPDLEKILFVDDEVMIVEKFAQPPKTDGQLNRTTANSPKPH